MNDKTKHIGFIGLGEWASDGLNIQKADTP